MRVVVVGATGNTGTSLLELLQHEPGVDELVGVARRLPAKSPFDGVRWRAADISCDDLAPVLAGADVVVHLAWLIQPMHDRETLDATNVTGTDRLLRAAAAAQVGAVVYASSIGAYSPGPTEGSGSGPDDWRGGGPGGGPIDDGSSRRPVDESWPTGGIPGNLYSAQKAQTERMLDAFEAAHPDIRVVRIRPGLIFKRQAATSIRRYFFGPFFPTSLVAPGRLPLVPDVAGISAQCVHSLDVADAYRRAIVDERARGAYNVAAAPPLTAAVAARALRSRAVPVPAGVARVAARLLWHLRLQPVHPSWLRLALEAPLLDTGRIERELGWQPRRDAVSTLLELAQGIHDGAGFPTPPLDPATSGPLRLREFATGVGGRSGA